MQPTYDQLLQALSDFLAASRDQHDPELLSARQQASVLLRKTGVVSTMETTETDGNFTGIKRHYVKCVAVKMVEKLKATVESLQETMVRQEKRLADLEARNALLSRAEKTHTGHR